MKHLNRVVAFCLLVVFSGISCNSQNSSNSVLSDRIWVVYQDSDNNYWFGSNGDGLYRYDGKNLHQFTREDGLVDNQIRGIQEDKNGTLFIETPSGINTYDGNSFSLLEPITSSVVQWRLDPDDLWFGYNAVDIFRYDGTSLYRLMLPRQNIAEKLGENEYAKYSPYTVYGLDKDRAGNLWIGTLSAGAFRYDGESFLWIGEKELSTLPDGRVPGVRSILQDKEGYYWISNFNSKYRIDSTLADGYEKLKAVDLPKDVIEDKILYFNSGLVDQAGNLWMTTYEGGVWKYDGDSITNTEINNGEETVLLISIYQDNKGVIWLGTDNYGVYRLNGTKFERFIP